MTSPGAAGPLDWSTDVLPGHERVTLPSTPGAPLTRVSGAASPVRTLVRSTFQPAEPQAVVLQVHGYNDYFFQAHVSDAVTGAGYAFYAVDMRRAGRSLRPGDVPHHISDIAELGTDIGDAVQAARHDAGDLPVIIHAHSTGALAATIWAVDRADPALAGLVLNSPLFGLMLSRRQRIAMSATPALARMRSQQVVVPAPSVYSGRLVANGWTFDHAWKKPGGQPATAGWLAATHLARKRVARGLDVPVPVLLAHADSSGPDRLDNPLLDAQDTVVDVAAIAAASTRLGDHVEHLVIPGAMHDLSLSTPGPRKQYLDAMLAWMSTVVR